MKGTTLSFSAETGCCIFPNQSLRQTTAVAFGSLWMSNHPGTSSMGQLLALSLACTMAAAILFQPLLVGAPRKKVGQSPVPEKEAS